LDANFPRVVLSCGSARAFWKRAMWQTPEFYVAVFAGITLIIYFTTVIVGAAISIFRKIDKMKSEILTDVNVKHRENDARYQALNALVIRHDVQLNPEFNGNLGAKHHGR
jgi:hypothetical protein